MKLGLAIVITGVVTCATLTGADAQRPSRQLNKQANSAAEAALTAPDSQLAIQLANDYFNATRVMTADFTQVGADGRRSDGKLYVMKPGRLRFEYALPATMEIIADGVSVAIRDRKLQTQQLYFVSQTPLKFLLKDSLDLKKDLKIMSVTSDDKSSIIIIEDSSTFGGPSVIKLYFDLKDFALQQWEVTDPQGYQTVLTLHNIDLKTMPDRTLFQIPPTSFWPMQN